MAAPQSANTVEPRDVLDPNRPHGTATSTEDDSNVALAWRLLSSPRTFLVLCALLALLFVVAAGLPQRPTATELLRALPFAPADVASSLGLIDIVAAWPTLLLLLLLALNATGMFVAHALQRGEHERRFTPQANGIVAFATTFVSAPIDTVRARIGQTTDLGKLALHVSPQRTVARRGLVREGAALAAFGLIALFVAFWVARTSALDARLEVMPSTRVLADALVRDGEVFVPRTIPYGIMCERPDPQDPHRAFDCRMASTGASAPTAFSLAPGYATKVGDIELTPVREARRRFTQSESLDLVLTRGASVERLKLEPEKPIALRTGEQLTAFMGPDGPLIVVEPKDGPPQLLAPRIQAASAKASPSIAIEVEAPSRLLITATTAPEATLVLAGVLLFVLGLLLMGLVPHLEIALDSTVDGTRITVTSSNRPDLPRMTLAKLTALPATPPSSAAGPS